MDKCEENVLTLRLVPCLLRQCDCILTWGMGKSASVIWVGCELWEWQASVSLPLCLSIYWYAYVDKSSAIDRPINADINRTSAWHLFEINFIPVTEDLLTKVNQPGGTNPWTLEAFCFSHHISVNVTSSITQPWELNTVLATTTENINSLYLSAVAVWLMLLWILIIT